MDTNLAETALLLLKKITCQIPPGVGITFLPSKCGEINVSERLLFFLQDGALDLLRELKNIKMSLETLQVINPTPPPCHRHLKSDATWCGLVVTAVT